MIVLFNKSKYRIIFERYIIEIKVLKKTKISNLMNCFCLLLKSFKKCLR